MKNKVINLINEAFEQRPATVIYIISTIPVILGVGILSESFAVAFITMGIAGGILAFLVSES